MLAISLGRPWAPFFLNENKDFGVESRRNLKPTENLWGPTGVPRSARYAFAIAVALTGEAGSNFTNPIVH